MQPITSPSDRRGFLRLALSLSTSVLLAGCGGGGGSSETSAVTPTTGTAAPAAGSSTTVGSHPLNAALNLAYLGAQYYGFAARGAGLTANLTSGVGRPGVALGAREASFSDPAIAAHAADLADDKQAHVVGLRGQIGALAAAQPQLDLSTTATSAFSVAARGAGVAGAASGFDPYASDTNFLIGAFFVENAVAAAYRTLLAQSGDAGDQTVLQAQLADAIYHGGLIRSLLDDRATTDASIGKALAGAGTMFAALDGSDVGDQTLGAATGASSNLLDADSRPIPFTRTSAQVLKALYLSSSGVGGFLPAGANGVAA